jgi:CrcB protein
VTKTLWVGIGGAVGAMARYHLGGWMQRLLGTSLPYGTLTVNVLGSFLLALLMVVSLETQSIPPTLRIALGTGVMGGFTTYSTFNYESLQYLQEGAWGMGALNMAVTVLACLLAGWLGWASGRLLVGT